MTVETASDRAAFVADFGVSVTGSATFTAIFDHQYLDSLDIVGEKPVLTAAYVSPVTTLSYGDAITVEGTNYTVIRVEHDGTGWALIILEEV